MAAASGSAAGRMMRFMLIAFGQNLDAALWVEEFFPCSQVDIEFVDKVRLLNG